MQGVEQLLYLQGVGDTYTGFYGESHTIDHETRLNALNAMGYQLHEAAKINAANQAIDALPWQSLLPVIQFTNEHEPNCYIHIDETELAETVDVKVKQHDKFVFEAKLNLSETSEIGEYHIDGKRYSRRTLKLMPMSAGYYDLDVFCGSKHAKGELVVSPKQCYAFKDAKQFGLSVQLYSVVSSTNAGIGDFTDLKNLITHSAKHGVDFILLNPLHTLFYDTPERASPYSPSDRRYLNPLYIAFDEEPDFYNCSQAQQLFDSHKTELAQERANTYINYSYVSDLKFSVLACMYEHFVNTECKQSTVRASEFNAFANSPQLRELANWQCANHQNIEDPNFAVYLQWLAQKQLQACQVLCIELGMKTGLVRDLAVGCAGDGSEVATSNGEFVQAASIGAPPDPWAALGQNWGMPPFNPQTLKENKFAQFRAILRANMKHCGALRVDHVMALLRLWWCLPTEQNPAAGTYVYYPLDELLALVRLESHRNQCALIGEDLGIVPEPIKHALETNNILSNLLFYFEKDQQGQFIPPEQLNPRALLMLANHDVPPFNAWWQSQDLALNASIGLIDPQVDGNEGYRQRQQDKTNLLNLINEPMFTLDSDAKDVFNALVLKLAHARCQLFSIQLDDLADEALPVNIPGTDKQYPNWRRRLSKPIDALFTNTRLFSQLKNIRKE